MASDPARCDGHGDGAVRFHLPLLPHTLPTPAYVHCAYTEKCRRFVLMMRSLGHTVDVYESTEPWPPEQNQDFPFDPEHPVWVRQNARMITEIRHHMQPRDILCLIAGRCQKPIADACPELLPVEFGIGYTGTFATCKVYESIWHMAFCYGFYREALGGHFDTVIPNSYDPAEFPFVEHKDDYLLFIGRLNWDKGVHVAADIAKRSGLALVMCGQGTPPDGVDYRGVVGAEERAALMGHARAVLVPTLYPEPFGGVNVEAQLCGTPVITTDFGAFPETVEQGVTGFRCHFLGEYLKAVSGVTELDPRVIRARAIAKYSIHNVKYQYERYFERVNLLWADGWNTEQVA